MPTEIRQTPAASPAAVDCAVKPQPSPGAATAHGFPVIFFDGVCGLCNKWIDFVMRHDRAEVFRFSPLQGETARDWLQMAPEESLNSVVLADASGVHRKTDAVWRILQRLGGIWRIAGALLRFVPPPVRNWGYDFVARHRYKWFGKKATCRLPSAAERARFLP